MDDFCLDDLGVPVVLGRRFPWAIRVGRANKPADAWGFTLMMENGWTAQVLCDEGPLGRLCLLTATSHKGRVWAETPGGINPPFPFLLTPRELLSAIDAVATFPSD